MHSILSNSLRKKSSAFWFSILATFLLSAQDDGPVYELNPFQVQPSEGYAATSTISGTGLNTPLANVPMSINVITSEFLQDSLTHDIVESLDYNSSITQTGRVSQAGPRPNNFSIRGFRNRNLLVDGVTGGITVPTQLVDRIEVVKGPNTLYGQSDPGGLVNIITKTPGSEDGGTVQFEVGDNEWQQIKLDVTTHAWDGKLGLRILGQHKDTGGWRWVDGKKSKFVGVSGNVELSEATEGIFLISSIEESGFPGERSTWSFERIPTDLNGDGDTDDTVNGTPEARVRYNSSFLPREYTSGTPENRFETENDFVMTGFRHSFNENHNLQYKFQRYDTHNTVSFREYNTFELNSTTGQIQSRWSNRWQDSTTLDEVHSLSDIINFETGNVKHQLLLGYRKSETESGGIGDFELSDNPNRSNVAGQDEVQAALEIEANTGKQFRRTVTKDEILGGARLWEDDNITWEEFRIYGANRRNSSVDFSVQNVDTIFASDNIYLMEDKLNILIGVRNIDLEQYSVGLTGSRVGTPVDASDTNFQLGGVYRLTPNMSAYLNLADAFEPNSSIDPDTGEFFAPQTSDAIELGVKFFDLADSKLSGSATVFQIEKDNVVRSAWNPDLNSGAGGNETSITSDKSQGFELELFANPTENWSIVAAYSYIDAKVVGARSPVLEGTRLEGATPHRFTFFNSYTFPEGPLSGLKLGGGLVWADGPIPQFPPGVINSGVLEDGYTTVDLFARYPAKIGDRTVTFGLNIDNATDEIFVRSRAALNEKRQIVFSATFDL